MPELGQAYGLAVLLGGFLLLTALALRGHSIFVAAPLCACLILAFSGADPLAGMKGGFMTGFADYLRRFYLIFALGAAFGKLMERSGAAAVIARSVLNKIGSRWACLAVVLACAVLTYGGVSLFVVGFATYPLAVHAFRAADLPRRFIPAAIAFGSVTFTMTSAGSPEIQNLIPIDYLVGAAGNKLSDARAGWPVSLIVAGVMFGMGQLYLETAIARAKKKGERFDSRSGDAAAGETAADAPSLVRSLAPLVTTVAALNLLPRLFSLVGGMLPAEEGAAAPFQWLAGLAAWFPEDATLAIFLGVVVAAACLGRRVPTLRTDVGDGFVNGLIAIGSTCSVVGFGKAVEGLPAFAAIVDWATHLPMAPLAGAALAVAVVCGLAGSASGGQAIAWPIIKPIYVDSLGVAPRALHRTVAIASGTLDTLPANGYLVVLIRNVCGETHAAAYFPICVTCTMIPAVGTMLAILLFELVPAWAVM